MKIDDEIDNVVKMVLNMSSTVLDSLNKSFNYYKGLARPEINDDIIDKTEREIEETILDIMVKERPFAKDMRQLSGILTLVSDVERLGDHAEDITNINDNLAKYKKYESKIITEMIDKTYSMVKRGITSFINKDIDMALEVINNDDEIDLLFLNAIEEIIRNTKNIDSSVAIYQTLMVKYIERVADHAVNIAEWVIFLVNGYYKDKQIF